MPLRDGDGIVALARALKERRLSSRELVETALARVAAGNTALNAFITVTAEEALAAADAADKQLADGTGGPLTGLPMAHKDSFCTRGVLTTCASKMLADFVSPYDAAVVEAFAAAGTACIGKTNMDEFAMGSSSESSFFGAVRNPWNHDCSPGGSSGGSAAAVAAGWVPFATGTDTGGSVRQPAALCGIIGFKPSYGRVSRHGMVAHASSLDHAGVLARSAEDAALLLQVMAGFDPRDSTSADVPVPDYMAALGQPLKGRRIGVPAEFFGGGLDTECESRVREALEVLRGLGAELVDLSLPHLSLSVPVYHVIAPAEAASSMARFDGVRFGHRSERAASLEELYQHSRQEGLGATVRERILIGTWVTMAEHYEARYLKAQRVRRIIVDELRAALKEVDVIAGPTTQAPAFRLGGKLEDPVQMADNDIYTIIANLAGVPAISVPCGLVRGLPVGLQLIGAAFDEAAVLNVAHQYQQATDWHLQRPAVGGAAS